MNQGLAKLLTSGDTHGASLVVAIVDTYGTEALTWTPEVLEMNLKDDTGVNMLDLVEDRFHAASSILTTNMPHLSVIGFCQVVRALNFKAIDANLFIPADLEDVVNGCIEMRLLEGSEEFHGADFSHDVRRYVGILLENNAITTPPKLLQFAEYDPNAMDSRNLALSTDAFMNEVYMRSQQDKLDAIQERCDQVVLEILTQVASVGLRNGDEAQLRDFLKKMNSEALHE